MWIVALGKGARPDGWEQELGRVLEHPVQYIRQIALERAPAPLPVAHVPSLQRALAIDDIDLNYAALEVVGRDKIIATKPAIVQILRRTNESMLLNNASNALYSMGAHAERVDTIVSRLADPERLETTLDMLFHLFEGFSGRDAGDSVTKDQALALEARWRTFVNARRASIQAGKLLSLDDPLVTKDLVPPNWKVNRTGKPDWPQGD